MGSRPGRNQLCPCGSGKKYKKCHGLSATSGPAATGSVAATSPPITSAPNVEPQPATPDAIYCSLMEDVKRRIELLRRITAGSLRHGAELFDYECASLHLRKVLEAIAFGSLCANRDEYAKVHANFEKHWRAKDLLRALEKVNPHFYPEPHRFAPPTKPGQKLLEPVPDGYLSQQEFVELYDMCNKVLHVWNPFSPEVRHINFVRTVDDWVGRIQRLLDMHRMQLAGSEEIWIIQMVHPEDGKAHAFRASPRQP